MEVDNHIDELLARHFAKEALTADQQAELDAWIAANGDEYRKLRMLMDMPALSGQQDFDAEKAWRKVENRLRKPARLHLRRGAIAMWSAAASVMILVAVTAVLFFRKPEVETFHYANTTQTEESVLLPDSSEVVLYPNSSLAYAGETAGRKVDLKGKAFFRVKKNGQPFAVNAGELQVEVLGTSFLINAFDKERSGVYVKTGRVKASVRQSEVVLTANQKAVLTDGVLLRDSIFNPRMQFENQSRNMAFDKTPLSRVVEKVKELTDVEIVLGKGLEHQLVTTRIYTDDYESIAAELAFICGCRCDTVVTGKQYILHYEKGRP